ncbi:uncharacterized protein LOC136070957 [Quercus suber]|uniref:uncharacterized protein LOC136070957 n=1 Tax=Quercus suber TaxID=58331 RepID=UPI0032DF74E8
MVFVKSVDASDIVKSTRNLFKLFDEVVTWVGPKNIVHMVTDNASNYVSAGKLLCEKYKTISWSPCAAHCLNLVLQDMGDMPHVERLKSRATKVTVFVYNHVALIAWLRKRPGWTDIVPWEQQDLLLLSFHLEAFILARESKAKEVVSIILDNSFWDDINVLVKISSPLIRLLRIVDSDQRPAIGYVYEGMHRARLGIKKIFRMKKHLYKPYTSIIKNRWDKHLRKDLHAAAYWLNPAFQYDEENFCRKPAVNMAVLDYIGTKYDGDKEKVIKETQYFRDRIGSFDRDLALSTSTTTHPGENLFVYVDYASIDKTDFWVYVEEEDPYLNYEELENAIYEEGAYPAEPSNIEESVDDSSEVEGIGLGTFGQPISPPPGFSRNDDEHANFHDIDDLSS